MTPKRIAIIGGGISGLSAAFTLAQARKGGAPVEEYVFEGSARLGGLLRTEPVEGFLVEAGADSFLTEKKEALELCEQVGLVAQLIGSQDEHRRTWILHRGRLIPLPDGFEFILPTRLAPLLRTRLLSWRDKMTLVSRWLDPRRLIGGEESVAGFVLRHFGSGLLENIAEPLLGAVYGADPERLSTSAALPQVSELVKTHGSLRRGLRHMGRQRQAARQRRRDDAPPAPLFTTLRDGLETLVAALRLNLEEARLLCQRRVLGLERGAVGIELRLEGGESFSTDAVIVALPAREAAGLLRDLDASAATTLRDIPYSSSVIVALGYEEQHVPSLPSGFGLVVPRREGKRLRACTFVGQKFRGRVPPGGVLFRCFLGGSRDEAVLDLADSEAVRVVQRELEGILRIAGQPVLARVYRWPKAMPQYTVGHRKRVEALRARLAHQPGLFLCGNAYEGIGIPDCIRSGKLAAEECLRFLQQS